MHVYIIHKYIFFIRSDFNQYIMVSFCFLLQIYVIINSTKLSLPSRSVGFPRDMLRRPERLGFN